MHISYAPRPWFLKYRLRPACKTLCMSSECGQELGHPIVCTLLGGVRLLYCCFNKSGSDAGPRMRTRIDIETRYVLTHRDVSRIFYVLSNCWSLFIYHHEYCLLAIWCMESSLGKDERLDKSDTSFQLAPLCLRRSCVFPSFCAWKM